MFEEFLCLVHWLDPRLFPTTATVSSGHSLFCSCASHVPFTQLTTARLSPLISNMFMAPLTFTSQSSGGNFLDSFPSPPFDSFFVFFLKCVIGSFTRASKACFEICPFRLVLQTSCLFRPFRPTWMQVSPSGRVVGIHAHTQRTSSSPPRRDLPRNTTCSAAKAETLVSSCRFPSVFPCFSHQSIRSGACPPPSSSLLVTSTSSQTREAT